VKYPCHKIINKYIVKIEIIGEKYGSVISIKKALLTFWGNPQRSHMEYLR
jgi:hypothetical protein